jgi:hypothetical protein
MKHDMDFSPTAVDFTKRSKRSALLLVVLGLAMLAGCGGPKGPEIVAVRGKVTYAGGAWPKEGRITFAPIKPAQGFPAMPGTAVFQADGSYVVASGLREGLVPGKYRICVSCWKVEPEDNQKGVNYVAEKFAAPATSPLELEIAPGAGTVTWDHDFPAEK